MNVLYKLFFSIPLLAPTMILSMQGYPVDLNEAAAYAISIGDTAMLAELLKYNEADVDHISMQTNLTLLQDAAQRNNLGALEVLLHYYHANLNKLGSNQLSPLQYAVDNNNFEAAHMLLRAGANASRVVTKQAVTDASLVRLLLCYSAPRTAENFVLLAAQRGDSKNVELLVKSDPDTVNYTNSLGWTPLIIAVMNGQACIVKLLIENKAQINTCDRQGLTALDWANKTNNSSIIDLLKSHNAQSGLDASHDYPSDNQSQLGNIVAWIFEGLNFFARTIA